MENPKLYSSANGMQKKDAEEILSQFRDKIKWKNHGRILDIGCGSGEVTTEIILPQLPKDFDKLIGLDVSLDMIEHAANFHSHFKVHFIQLDIAQRSENILDDIANALKKNLNPDEKPDIVPKVYDRKIFKGKTLGLDDQMSMGFDVVFSFYCLHWVTDQRLALKNIYQCLRPGGEALLVFLVQSPIFTLYKELSKERVWKEYMQDVDNFIPLYQDSDSPKEIFGRLVGASGFDILQLECQKKHYVFETFSSLRSAIIAVNPFLPKIPNVLRDDFIDECLYLTKIHKLAAFKNNHYHVTYKLMIAHIRKP